MVGADELVCRPSLLFSGYRSQFGQHGDKLCLKNHATFQFMSTHLTTEKNPV